MEEEDLRIWRDLLAQFTVIGELLPATLEEVAAAEEKWKVRLPASYIAYSLVFGPGCLKGARSADIATPHHPGALDLEVVNQTRFGAHREEIQLYCGDPDLFHRGLFFANDTTKFTFGTRITSRMPPRTKWRSTTWMKVCPM